ncbi:MAG: glutaminyl-peptide cyclotransferase, partial [Ferruginibacter sp.]
MRYITVLFIICIMTACNNNNDYKPNDPDVKGTYSGIEEPANLTFTILAQHPHDTSAYTQGLQLYNGKLFEGTGDYENSSLRITDWKTGVVEKKHLMGSDKIFGEGINIFKEKLYQLTWESHLVYVYDLKNIDKPVSTFQWPNEGWGITNNGKELIISDGSSNLYFV